MGNSGAGVRLGEASQTSDVATSDSSQIQSFEIEVSSHLGMQLSLVEETFSADIALRMDVPRAIESRAGLLRLGGPQPVGHAVYSCKVSVRQTAPREMILHTTDGKKGKGEKRVAVHGVDLRGKDTEQFLALVLALQGSRLWGGVTCAFGAAYGAFESQAEALAQAADAVVANDGERGVCVWRRHVANGRCRISLEVRKTDGALLSQRSAMLDSLSKGQGQDSTRTTVSQQGAGEVAIDPLTPTSVKPGAVLAASSARSQVHQQRAVAEARGGRSTAAVVEQNNDGLSADNLEDPSAAAQVNSAPGGSSTAAVVEQNNDGLSADNWEAPSAAAQVSRAPRLVNDEGEVKRQEAEPPREEAEGLDVAPVLGPARQGGKMCPHVDPAGSSKLPGRSISPATQDDAREAAEAQLSMDSLASVVSEHLMGEGLQVPDRGVVTTPTQAPQPQPERSARSRATGALAIRAKAAAEEAAERRQAEVKRKREEEETEASRLREQEEAVARAREEELLLRQAQDQEFQQSLLMDQLKDLLARQEHLQIEARAAAAEATESNTARSHAAQRLERFGHNPRLEEEVQRASERFHTADSGRIELERELAEVDADIAEKNALLSAMLA